MADHVDCKLFYFVAWGIIGGALCIFGFVGNTLSLLAFQKDKRLPPTTLLQALALSDFVLLLSVFITDPVPYVCDYVIGCVNPWVSWPFIRYIWILTPIAHMCSIWFVVLIALNRYYAVCQALDMGRVWNNQKTPIYIFIVLFVVVAFNMPRFLEYKVVREQISCTEQDDDFHNLIDNTTLSYNLNASSQVISQLPINRSNTTLSTEPCWKWREKRSDFGSNASYKVVYKVLLVNILLVLVPIILLIAFTLKILISLKENKKRIKTVKNTNRNGVSAATRKCSVKKQRNNKNSHEITVILTLVVVVAIICQAPLCVFHFVRYTAGYKCGHIVFYLDNISKLLINVNSAANFIIYCLFSPKFRRLLLSFWVCYICGFGSYDHQRDYTSVSRREYSVRELRTENITSKTQKFDKKSDSDDKVESEDKSDIKPTNQKEVTFDTSLSQLNINKEANGGIPLNELHHIPKKGHTGNTSL